MKHPFQSLPKIDTPFSLHSVERVVNQGIDFIACALTVVKDAVDLIKGVGIE